MQSSLEVGDHDSGQHDLHMTWQADVRRHNAQTSGSKRQFSAAGC